MSLIFNMLSRFVIAFLPRRKLLFCVCSHHPQWIWSPRKWNMLLLPLFPHLFAMKSWEQMPWSYFFECWVLNQLFHSLTFIKRLFSSSLLSTLRVISSAYLRFLIVLPEIFIPALGLTALKIAESCPSLCNPIDCSTPGFPVFHSLSLL